MGTPEPKSNESLPEQAINTWFVFVTELRDVMTVFACKIKSVTEAYQILI